jgi:hypothetical protein
MTAGAAAAVAAVLLVGAWLLLGGPTRAQAGNPVADDVARTTELTTPPDPSDGSTPPRPFPTVPSAQVRGEHVSPWGVRTGTDGRQLLIQLVETDCFSEEVRLLGEQADRVEVELRTVAKPPPPSAEIGPDGSYGCMGYGSADGPYAVVDLRDAIG